MPIPLESGLSECARYPSALACEGLYTVPALLTLCCGLMLSAAASAHGLAS